MGLPQIPERCKKDFDLPATDGDDCTPSENIFSNESEKL